MRESLFWMSVVQTVLFLVIFVSLTTNIACLSSQISPHSLFSHYFIITVLRKTFAILLEQCISGSGSDHFFFVFEGKMKDLERSSSVLGIWLGSLVNLNTCCKSSLHLETVFVGSLAVLKSEQLSAARRRAGSYPGKRLGQSAQKILGMKIFQAQERLRDEKQDFFAGSSKKCCVQQQFTLSLCYKEQIYRAVL